MLQRETPRSVAVVRASFIRALGNAKRPWGRGRFVKGEEWRKTFTNTLTIVKSGSPFFIKTVPCNCLTFSACKRESVEHRTMCADGGVPPLTAALQVMSHPRACLPHSEFTLISSSFVSLISLCRNCIFPKMFSKVILFWFHRLSFQCWGWSWGGALWKVNAFEWWSFLWREIEYCSTLKFLRGSLCYLISRFPSIFSFQTFQNDIKQPCFCYEIEEALLSVGRPVVRGLSSRDNQSYCSCQIYWQIKRKSSLPAAHCDVFLYIYNP